MAVDALGTAVAVWSDLGLTGAHYTGRWHVPQVVSTGAASAVRVAMVKGVAVAVWVDYQARRLFASRSTAPDIWDSPVVLGEWTEQFAVPLKPNVVVTSLGTAVVAWPSEPEFPFRLTFRRFESGQWTAPDVLSVQADLLPHTRDLLDLTSFGERSVLISCAEVDRSMRLRAFVSRYDFDRP